MAHQLGPELEELWNDYRHSLARRGRSSQTESVYRKAFENFWRWHEEQGLPPDPATVDYRVVNRWADALATISATNNGRVMTTVDPATGDPVPKMLEPSTRRLLWRNLRPFFSWYAKEFDTANAFHRADAPGDDRPSPVPVVKIDDHNWATSSVPRAGVKVTSCTSRVGRLLRWRTGTAHPPRPSARKQAANSVSVIDCDPPRSRRPARSGADRRGHRCGAPARCVAHDRLSQMRRDARAHRPAAASRRPVYLVMGRQ